MLARGDPVVMLLREPARPAVVREHRLAPWLAVATVCFGAFMGQLDASIVTLAFPALQRQFGVGLAGVQWVSLAYLLALVALLVPVGRWSDRSGRKLVYLYGFVLFSAASAACGLASALPALIGLRVAQAAGAAMLQANSVALVATSAPGGRRRAALGVQAAAQAAAAVVAGAGLIWWERRSPAPLIDLPLLAAAGIAPALGGALCVYMVLFGPLVLLPQTLAVHGEGALRAGLLLTAFRPGSGWPRWQPSACCRRAGRTGGAAPPGACSPPAR